MMSPEFLVFSTWSSLDNNRIADELRAIMGTDLRPKINLYLGEGGYLKPIEVASPSEHYICQAAFLNIAQSSFLDLVNDPGWVVRNFEASFHNVKFSSEQDVAKLIRELENRAKGGAPGTLQPETKIEGTINLDFGNVTLPTQSIAGTDISTMKELLTHLEVTCTIGIKFDREQFKKDALDIILDALLKKKD